MNCANVEDILIGYRLSTDEPFAYNILIHVFRYLDIKDLLNCSNVCKLWSWVVLEAEPWKTHPINCCSKHISSAASKYGNYIRDLALLNPKLLPNETVSTVLSNMKYLRKIKLHGCHKDQLDLLRNHSPNLEKVFAEINWGSPPIDISFITSLTSLTHLEIITYIKVSGFEGFRNLRNLKHLTFTAPCEETCWQHIVELENLESLKLCANIGITWDTGLFDSNFYLKELKNLRKLEICDLPYLHEYNIIEKIKDLPNIKELILQNVSISRAGTSNFNRVLASCSYIEKLTISIFRVVFYNNILDVALENSQILKGTSALKNSLKEFTWIMDPSGISKVQDFYAVENATVLKVKWSHLENSENNIRYPWAIEDDVAPVSMTKLLTILKKRLPNTKVTLLKQFETTNVPKIQCFFCSEKIQTIEDRMDSYN